MTNKLIKQHNHNLSVAQILNTLRDLGVAPAEGRRILDFGCGAGEKVSYLLDLGFDAYGCDITEGATLMKDTVLPVGLIGGNEKLKAIPLDPYRLPFADDFFDIVISDQVFEHVQDYPLALSEISRVLKSDGCCLHVFPSRWSPIEVHLFIPFGGVFQHKVWLWLWALLGVRNQFQNGMSIKEVANSNLEYLSSSINYLSSNQIAQHFRTHFSKFLFCEEIYLKYVSSKRAKIMYSIIKVLPLGFRLYSALRSRVVFAAFPVKANI